ncbi:MAG: hypothetical protein ABJC66_10915 [Gammaproteobacteria bacterium]
MNLANPRDNLGGYQKWGVSLALEYSWSAAWRVIGGVRLTNDPSGQPATSTLYASGYKCGSQEPATGSWSFYCADIPHTRHYSLTPSTPDSVTRTLQTSVPRVASGGLQRRQSLGELPQQRLDRTDYPGISRPASYGTH